MQVKDDEPIQYLTARFEKPNTFLNMCKKTIVEGTSYRDVFVLSYCDAYTEYAKDYKGIQYFLLEDQELAIQTFTHRLLNPESIDKAIGLNNRLAITDRLDLFKKEEN